MQQPVLAQRPKGACSRSLGRRPSVGPLFTGSEAQSAFREGCDMPNLLVASNDLALRTLLRIRFAPWVSVDASATSSDALLRAIDSFPDVVVLDVLAADCDLPRFLDTLRAR